MNLTTDPWIPVVLHNGNPELVSLKEAFARSAEITDLAVRPHERIALMRLLICIAQAALDGPKDEEDWQKCKGRIIPAVPAYLDKWKSAFALFGDGPRFLQVRGIKKDASQKPEDEEDEGKSVSKLDLALATGNNSTLFDNAGGSNRPFTPAQLALMLLTFQCFSPGGLIGFVVWKGIKTLKTSAHAPCLAGNMLHTLVNGENMSITIHQNMLAKHAVMRFAGENRWGVPVWEQFPQSFKDKAAVDNATMTYLGRLAPISRAILLNPDCSSMVLGNGLTYPSFEEWREPMATIVVRKIKNDEKRVTLSISLDKGVWRELHALVVKAVDRTSNGGPLSLSHQTTSNSMDLWVGGFVAKKAKPLDTSESVFHVPAAMFSSASQNIYEHGVDWAQKLAGNLGRAVSAFHNNLGDKLDRREARDRAMAIKGKALRHYWTAAEGFLDLLFKVAETASQSVSWENSEWGRKLWRARLDAYSYSCPHETPRQMQAYALGLKVLTGFQNVNNQEVDKEDAHNEP